MRNAGKNLEETCMRIRALTHPKKTVRAGCWNARTMCSTGKSAQVCREMARYKIEILGISECRWTGSGHQAGKGNEDGRERHGENGRKRTR